MRARRKEAKGSEEMGWVGFRWGNASLRIRIWGRWTGDMMRMGDEDGGRMEDREEGGYCAGLYCTVLSMFSGPGLGWGELAKARQLAASSMGHSSQGGKGGEKGGGKGGG